MRFKVTSGDWGFLSSEPQLAYRVRSRLNFQMKPVLTLTVFDLLAFVGKSKGTLLAVNNLHMDSTPLYTHISFVNLIKQILRRYGQPSEFSEFPRRISRYIFLPQDRKTIKKTAKSISPLTADHSRRFLSAAVTHGISAFNFRWFQQAIRSCGIVLTVNQRCGQNLAAVSSSLGDLVSRPILAGLRT